MSAPLLRTCLNQAANECRLYVPQTHSNRTGKLETMPIVLYRNWRTFLLASFVMLTLLLSGCGENGTSSTSATAPVHPTATAKATATPTPATVPTPTPTVSVASPVRLVIPSIGVNAPIENVGLTDSGNLATPQQNQWDGTGWYSQGPHPGEPGSAVIDGHLDRPGGSPAVFWNLRYMHVGDMIMVVDSAGVTHTFRVTQAASYPANQSPTQDIFVNTSGTFLNLITCAGDWIPAQHQTTLRFVVYSSLVK